MLDLCLKFPNLASISKSQLSILNNIGTLISIMSTPNGTVNFKSRQQYKPKQSFVILHRTILCKLDGRYFLGLMSKGQSKKTKKYSLTTHLNIFFCKATQYLSRPSKNEATHDNLKYIVFHLKNIFFYKVFSLMIEYLLGR